MDTDIECLCSFGLGGEVAGLLTEDNEARAMNEKFTVDSKKCTCFSQSYEGDEVSPWAVCL